MLVDDAQAVAPRIRGGLPANGGAADGIAGIAGNQSQIVRAAVRAVGLGDVATALMPSALSVPAVDGLFARSHRHVRATYDAVVQVHLNAPADVDCELRAWLKAAFALAV
jgi:hypothetical protein